jgi:GMP synthase-like glutamine amidotransferase
LDSAIAEQFGSYGEMSERLFHSVANIHGVKFDCMRYAADQLQLPHSVSDCDGYLITGSRCSAYDDQTWIHKLQSLIHSMVAKRIPCIGICFGHQLLAHTLGGKVERFSQGWGVGVATFEITRQQTWMQPALAQANLLVSHQDQVIALPNGATRLMGNEFCINAMFEFDKTVLGLQAHPEFQADYVRYLIEKRKHNIGSAKAESALESLSLATHHQEIAQWLGKFLTQ